MSEVKALVSVLEQLNAFKNMLSWCIAGAGEGENGKHFLAMGGNSCSRVNCAKSMKVNGASIWNSCFWLASINALTSSGRNNNWQKLLKKILAGELCVSVSVYLSA